MYNVYYIYNTYRWRGSSAGLCCRICFECLLGRWLRVHRFLTDLLRVVWWLFSPWETGTCFGRHLYDECNPFAWKCWSFVELLSYWYLPKFLVAYDLLGLFFSLCSPVKAQLPHLTSQPTGCWSPPDDALAVARPCHPMLTLQRQRRIWRPWVQPCLFAWWPNCEDVLGEGCDVASELQRRKTVRKQARKWPKMCSEIVYRVT